MNYKTGFIIGAAIGYFFGAKAGRERYDQITEAWGRVTGNERVQDLTAKSKAVVDLATDRVKETIGERFGHEEDAADA